MRKTKRRQNKKLSKVHQGREGKRQGTQRQEHNQYFIQSRLRSLLPLNHDDVVAELGLDGWVGVHRVGEVGNWQGKGSILERAYHGASCHPPQVTLSGGKVDVR